MDGERVTPLAESEPTDKPADTSDGSRAADKQIGSPEDSKPIPAPIGEDYRTAEEARFITDQQETFCNGCKIAVHDSQGRVVFTSKKKKVFSGDSKEPLVYLKKKWCKWEVYNEKKDLLFKMGKTSIFQWRRSFDIFVAGNDSRSADFRMNVNFFKTKFFIHHLSTPVAEIRKKQSCKLSCQPTTHYNIKAYAGADYAFIACLIVIMETDKSEILKMDFIPNVIDIVTGILCV